MHEAMEEGGTFVEVGREGSDVGAAMQEHMEWRGTIIEEEIVDPTTFATYQFVWSGFRSTV